jgi:F-type H+-transporting ATPase subunit alpha
MGEYFLNQGKDVLCVYDDLSKHAVAYRALSLLLKRPPGREAYPGDVFYLHSRLLERACSLTKIRRRLAYCPAYHRNTGRRRICVHSYKRNFNTDGQIFLETDLFNAGVRPAVNPGISVSRVGAAAQIKAMKRFQAR